MTTYIVPTTAGPQQLTTTLSGVEYRMTLTWNPVSEHWQMDLTTPAGSPIISSIPVVANTDLFAPFRHLGLVGSLVAQTAGAVNQAPTFESLGGATQLYYIAP